MATQAFRILVTNDDGVGSAGLGVLASHLHAAGHDVFVVAPSAEASGSSAAIGGILPGETITSAKVELAKAPAVPAHSVDGPPGRCVLAAALGAFGPPPQLVFSGINPGANVGKFLQLHSGTLGAALTAAGMGINALAVSIDNTVEDASGASEPINWDTAGILAARLVDHLGACPPRTVLNFNVPDSPVDAVRDIRAAKVGSGAGTRLTVEGEAPGIQTIAHTKAAPNPNRPRPTDTDTSLVEQGFAVLTRVVPPADVPVGDLPNILG